MNKKILSAGFLALALVLTACGGGNTPETTSQQGSQSEASSSQAASSSTPSPSHKLAQGAMDLSTMPWKEKSKIVAALEKYAMENHSAGIPIYDDASYEQFSQRVKLPSRTYLTNYGFGVGYGTIEGTRMYDGDIVESNEKWKSYFHGYTNTDSGTFNGWNATGSDVSDRMSMISSSYFGIKANDSYTDYDWVSSLATVNEPIMLDAEGNPIDLTGLSQEERESKTSQFWRVPLHTGKGYTYRYVGKESLKAVYDGREVAIEDYLTPFKVMLNEKLTRFAELVSDAGGFQGAMEYVYDSSKKAAAASDWTKSGVGIQISPDGKGLDFAFIQPKSISYARTSLSSQLYSPVPESFLKDIGSIDNYGKKGEGEAVFDNILIFGPYVPEYWEQGKKIVFQKNATYYEASDYHYDGYTEVVFSSEGGKSDELAYAAFLNNELDEVTIPTKYIADNKSKGLPTKGSTIIKLNVNSCTEEEWEYYFGENGTIYPHKQEKYWPVKPIMSNEDFLNGMYFAINRKLYAEKAGRNPAMGYLSDAYMLDPAGKVAYRHSEEGKSVLANYEKVAGEGNFGYSATYAQRLFQNAAKKLVGDGIYEPNDEIEIIGLYRYQSTIDNLGNDIAKDIMENFNKGAAAAGYPNLKLKIKLEIGGSSYTDTYTRMDHGEFDYAEGAISGNVLNPLEFMNTLSSTASLNQGFNLNWGHRTDLVSEKHPAIYEFEENGVTKGGAWSFDALYNASQGFTPVADGVATPIASNETFIDSGTNITWRAEFPPEAVNDQGESLFSFSMSDFSIGTTSGTSPAYSVGSSGTLTQDNNGYIKVRFSKKAITDAAATIADAEKATQKVFYISFVLIYSVTLESGTITKAIQVQSKPQNFEDFGIAPVDPA